MSPAAAGPGHIRAGRAGSEYSRIIYDYADHPNAIKFFGATTDKLEAAIDAIQRTVEATQARNSEILEERNRFINAGVDKATARRVTKQISLPQPDLKAFSAKLESVLPPGRTGHFLRYLARVIKPGYQFKRSDLMDLMQLCYAYDCDLFRCDKDMANTMRGYEPFNGKLVSRFSDLPDRINVTLSALSGR
ncbi:hypothetical protein [Paracoccus versutus]|uniref:hypothetical protein n=1 Tax=Paracoccus versutus TaxID=34007 RepID=UPI0011C018C6|nr:hypothetical protein [Paracoccus versutus]